MIWVPKKRAMELKMRISDEQRAKFRKEVSEALDNMDFRND